MHLFNIGNMRQELVEAGVQELLTPADVEAALGNHQGSTLLVYNSVCGCAAGGARPAVIEALSRGGKQPQKAVTVFAGQDKEATQAARDFMSEIPPSSPAYALIVDSKVVHFIPRSEIEGFDADDIADKLSTAFETHL